MDALTVAFTKDAFIQYFNNKNAAWQTDGKKYSDIIGIKTRYFENGRALPPMPLVRFRAEAEKSLKLYLVSTRHKNK